MKGFHNNFKFRGNKIKVPSVKERKRAMAIEAWAAHKQLESAQKHLEIAKEQLEDVEKQIKAEDEETHV